MSSWPAPSVTLSMRDRPTATGGSPPSSSASGEPPAPVNAKRVYRLMKKHGPLLFRPLTAAFGRADHLGWRRYAVGGSTKLAAEIADPRNLDRVVHLPPDILRARILANRLRL
jgi:hypothetical protein